MITERPFNNATPHTSLYGNWDFSNAPTVTGLATNSQTPNMTATAATHDHGIPNGTLLRKADGGTIEWTASAGGAITISGGAHSHTVTAD